MAKDWKMIRVPDELHAELNRLRKKFDDAQARGTMDVPSEFADRGGTPHWYVIAKAVEEFEDHAKRSNPRKSAKTGKAAAAGKGAE